MTKTFADHAQTYFERYRAIVGEIHETEAAIVQLQRKQQELQAQRAHMSHVIVNHIDTGDDIMMCVMKAEKTDAAEDCAVASLNTPFGKMRPLSAFGGSTLTALSTSYPYEAGSDYSSAMPTTSALAAGLEQSAHHGHWTKVDMGVGTVDLYSYASKNGKAQP